MSLDILKKQLKDGSLLNMYLFYGPEEYLKNHYFNILKSKTVTLEDFNYCIFEGKNLATQTLLATLEAFPAMEEKKLVLVKNSGVFKTPKISDKEFWQVQLKQIPDYVRLVFYESEVDKRSALINIIKKQGLCVEFGYAKHSDLSAWVHKIVYSSQKKIDAAAINHLISMCPPGMNQLKNELEKVINYCAGKQEISIDDIDAVISPAVESKVFVMLDCIFEKNYDKVFGLLADMKQLKEPPLKILTLIYRHFSILLKLTLLSRENMPESQMAKNLQIPPFAVRKYSDASRSFSGKNITHILKLCVDTDFAIKTGTLKDWNGIQMLLENIITL